MKKTRKMLAEEAKICLNCPYPKCKGGWGDGCAHYKAEMQKIKEKYRKGAKKNEVNKRHIKPTTQAV